MRREAKTRRVEARVDETLYVQATEEAEKSGCTVSDVVREALKKRLSTNFQNVVHEQPKSP